MKHIRILLLVTLVVPCLAYAAPGDTIRHQVITGQPADSGVRGIAKDWDDGNIYVAGFQFDSIHLYGFTFAKIDQDNLSQLGVGLRSGNHLMYASISDTGMKSPGQNT